MANKIAFYKITFTYNDAKEININMTLDKLASFFEKMNEKKIFWSDEEDELDNGFWTNLDNVRFIQLVGVKGKEDEPKDNDTSSDGEVSPEEVTDIPGD